jgi:uncharacterized protein
MSPLWKCLKKPHTYLAMLACFYATAALDSYRPPSNQWTAKVYIGAVHLYQEYGRPISSKYIQCRYRPTCSEYSLEAVRVYGIKCGLALTYHRLASCTKAVPLGTQDPVPQIEE